MDNCYKQLFQYSEDQKVILATDQNIVYMLSNKGTLYSLISNLTDDSRSIGEQLKKIICQQDSVIVASICFLSPHELDLPSYEFRKALIELNMKNQNTRIYLQGRETIVTKNLCDTMS